MLPKRDGMKMEESAARGVCKSLLFNNKQSFVRQQQVNILGNNNESEKIHQRQWHQ